MALFSRGGSPAPPSRTEPGSEELGSPAFHHLVETLEKEPERKYEILDLGPASGNHIEFFSRFRCRFHVASLEETLAEWRREEEEQPPPEPARLLPLAGSARFDLILCWDLLNYLDEEGLVLLADHLHTHTARGAWMHAFVHTRATMPARPGRFQLMSPERMRWLHGSAETAPAPRYAQRTLERLMPGFGVWQSRLLQNGFQEYLFQAV